MAVLGDKLDLMLLEVFSDLINSVVLFPTHLPSQRSSCGLRSSFRTSAAAQVTAGIVCKAPLRVATSFWECFPVLSAGNRRFVPELLSPVLLMHTLRRCYL